MENVHSAFAEDADVTCFRRMNVLYFNSWSMSDGMSARARLCVCARASVYVYMRA